MDTEVDDLISQMIDDDLLEDTDKNLNIPKHMPSEEFDLSRLTRIEEMIKDHSWDEKKQGIECSIQFSKYFLILTIFSIKIMQ